MILEPRGCPYCVGVLGTASSTVRVPAYLSYVYVYMVRRTRVRVHTVCSRRPARLYCTITRCTVVRVFLQSAGTCSHVYSYAYAKRQRHQVKEVADKAQALALGSEPGYQIWCDYQLGREIFDGIAQRRQKLSATCRKRGRSR